MRAFWHIPLRYWLFLAAIGGVLAMMILPPLARVSGPPPMMDPRWDQMIFIRHQIELYNMLNPDSPYDETTPAGPGFWDRLVEGNFLHTAPTNELQQYSTLVVDWPKKGAGWVWTTGPASAPSMFNLYRIDEAGELYDGDEDGTPD